MCKAQTFITKS